MRVKTERRSKRFVVEMSPQERSLPPVSLPELALKRILLPVDFSDSSRKAMQYAVSFARQFNAEVLLLHVVETAAPVPPQNMALESLALTATVREEAARHLSEWRGEIVSHVSVKAVVRDGPKAYHEIVSAASENNVDLIVLGTHGRTGLAHLFLGSTAERVVRHAPCPVLVVREHEHDFVARERAEQASATAG
jgi:nucleotide-binding universal stress UspA family protein